MKRLLAACAALACLTCATAPAFAKDSFVTMTLDGRLVDRAGGNAIRHNGVVYADTVDITKSFNGLYSFQKGGGAIISIGTNTGTFRPGTLYATINRVGVKLPRRPFVRDGELYVPLEFFIQHMADARVEFNAAKSRADIRVNATPPS